MKIGFITCQAVHPDWNVASTRFRVTWPAKYNEDFIVTEDINELLKCDVVVYQTRFEERDVQSVVGFKNAGIRVISDFTDPHWESEYGGSIPERLRFMVGQSDIITLPTENLRKSFLKEFPNKRVEIVLDRIDLEIYGQLRVHKDTDKYTILWHGSFGNRGSVEELARDDLERLGENYNIKLLCIYDNCEHYPIPEFDNIELECREWSEQAVIDGLLESDISINPKYDNWKNYKSNNKTVMSWALGVPCIERNFYREIKKYLDNTAKRKTVGADCRKIVEQQYDVKDTAKEWVDITDKLFMKRTNKKKNIAVYTSICGDFDGLREDQVIDDKAYYVAFVDTDLYSYVWDIRQVYKQFIDPVREAKIFKVLPWQYFDCDYSIWIDGTIAIKSKASDLVAKFLNGYDMAVFKHRQRDCIYDEYVVDMEYRKREPSYIREEQRDKYLKEKVPKHVGLWECGMLIRRHTEAVKRLCEEWWSEISVSSHSDQCSFARTVYKQKFKINPITPGNMYENPYFQYVPHNKTRAYSLNEASGTEQVLAISEINKSQKVKIKRVLKETFHSHFTGRMNYNDIKEVEGTVAIQFIKDYPGAFVIIN